MDFMTDEELDGYLVLIPFMLKKEILAIKKNLKRFWLKEIYKKRAADGLYNNLAHELQIGDRAFNFK